MASRVKNVNKRVQRLKMKTSDILSIATTKNPDGFSLDFNKDFRLDGEDEEDDKELYAEMTSEEQLTYRSAMTMDSEQDGHGLDRHGWSNGQLVMDSHGWPWVIINGHG